MVTNLIYLFIYKLSYIHLSSLGSINKKLLSCLVNKGVWGLGESIKDRKICEKNIFQKMLDQVLNEIKNVSTSADVKAVIKQQEVKELVVVACIFLMRSTFKTWNTMYHQACTFHLILLGISSSLDFFCWIWTESWLASISCT